MSDKKPEYVVETCFDGISYVIEKGVKFRIGVEIYSSSDSEQAQIVCDVVNQVAARAYRAGKSS